MKNARLWFYKSRDIKHYYHVDGLQEGVMNLVKDKELLSKIKVARTGEKMKALENEINIGLEQNHKEEKVLLQIYLNGGN